MRTLEVTYKNGLHAWQYTIAISHVAADTLGIVHAK